MKNSLLPFVAVVSVFAGFVFVANAQVPIAVPTKVGWIDTSAFSDPKAGINRYVAGLKSVDDSLKTQLTELQTLQTRYAAAINEINRLQQATPPPNPAELTAKQLDGAKIEREFEFRKKEYEAEAARRRGEVIGPVTADIMKVLQEYGKQKGYVTILDLGSMAQTNSLLYVDPLANCTSDFIAFYNAKSAAAPK